MDAAEVTEVCRLCPVTNTKLVSVFDERFSGNNNMKEVILVTTGIEVQENDQISVKICDRCRNITLKMFKFRQDAIFQDKSLREKRNQSIGYEEIRLPNTEVRIKRELSSTSSPKPARKNVDFHPSIAQVYRGYPTIKLPRSCQSIDMAPFVSLPMGEVENYFKQKKLNMNQYIWKSPPSINRVAKKRITQQKTVAPLKISKKPWKPHEQANKSTDSYVCTPVDEGKTRKRSSSCEFGGRAKLTKESIIVNNISERPVTPLEVTTPLVEQTTPELYQSEDSRDSVITNKSATSSSSNTYQPNQSESFGLTPTVTTMKSQTLLLCNLCGSVHNNASELKRHTMKHMVCQFCKRRFKSLESKNYHVNSICEIRKVMNSPGPVINLNKIDLDLEIRKKYTDAFTTFAPIPGILKPEEIVVKATSPLRTVNSENIIVLSDEDEDNADPLLGTPTAADTVPPLNNVSLNPEPVFNTSIVRPDIKLKSDDIISEFFGNNNIIEVTKGLLSRCNAVKITVEKMIQTDMPASKDIKIKPDASCEFKNLKDHIVPFKVPIHIINGQFNVAYKFTNPPKYGRKSGAWHSLPVVDVKKPPQLQPEVAYSKPVARSSTSIQPSVSLRVNDTHQSNNVQDVNSPTPILQTYFDRTPSASVPRKLQPIPKNYLPKNPSSALKTILTSSTPVKETSTKYILPNVNTSSNPTDNTTNQVLDRTPTSVNMSRGITVNLNNVTNNTTSRLSPSTLLGEMLDRTPTRPPLKDGVAANINNLLNNNPPLKSPASQLLNRMSNSRVSTNNTTLPNNSTNHVVLNNVVSMSNGKTLNNQIGVTTTGSINNSANVQNIPVSNQNQQRNIIYPPPLIISNTTANAYPPSTVSNAQRNPNPASMMPILQKNPPTFTQRNVRPSALATQRNVNTPRPTLQNIQRNGTFRSPAAPNTQLNVPPLVMANIQRNALVTPNSQRNNSNSTNMVEPAKFRVKDIRELQ